MTHIYSITGMTCSSCEAKVKSALLKIPQVESVAVSKENATATVTMQSHIALKTLQEALQPYNGKYQLLPQAHSEGVELAKSWVATYKPMLLIFFYITTISLIASYSHRSIHWMDAMRVFMAGFFLTFSFFKMLDLKGFAESYAMYDVVAKRNNSWGYIYAFIELLLGVAYLLNFKPFITAVVTIVVMAVSIVGVMQSVLNKRKIQCACLGAVFNLPMSSITIIEDALMIAMASVSLIVLM